MLAGVSYPEVGGFYQRWSIEGEASGWAVFVDR